MQKVKGKNRMGKTRGLFEKIGDVKGKFRTKMDIIKDRSGKDLRKQKRLRRGYKTTQEELCKKVLMTGITIMVRSLT